MPSIRGASAHFPALLGPYLMAPAWLIHNVDVAYRVALGWGSLWFSLAAFPAYALARRMEVSPRGALFVAAAALLVPDAAFTTTLLSEPFAYPVFLTTVLVAVDTIVAPTWRRQSLVIVLTVALCLLRLQFVCFALAYLAAALACNGFSASTLFRRQPLITGTVVVAALGGLVLGPARLAGVYAGVTTMHLPALSLAQWFALELFVLAVAAGWVIIPGAVVGLAHALRSGRPQRKAFAALTIAVTTVLVAESSVFGANEGRVHERYVFYVAPLIAVAFASCDREGHRSTLRILGYCTAAAAILVPLVSGIHAADDDQAPTLVGLHAIGGGGDRATLVWALLLTLLGLATALRLLRGRLVQIATLGLLTAVGAAATFSLLEFGTALGARLNVSTDIPHFHTPPGSALITSPVTNRFLLMKTLFWNPDVTRVLVLGRGSASDGYAAENVRLGPNGLVDADGTPVPGPFVVDTDTTIASPAPGRLRAFLFGLNRVDGYLETVSSLDLAAGRRALDVQLRLVSTKGRKEIAVSCGAPAQVVAVGASPSTIAFVVPHRTTRTCRISLVGGAPVLHRGRTVSVHARLRVHVAT